MIRIPNNFYNYFNFKNTIRSIKFSSNNDTNSQPLYTLVSQIGDNAFYNTNIESLTINNIESDATTITSTYTRIGYQSFAKNKRLTKINLSGLHYYIDDKAFSNCSTVLDVNIPISFSTSIVYFGNSIFSNVNMYDKLTLKFPTLSLDIHNDWYIIINNNKIPFKEIQVKDINNFSFQVGYLKEQTEVNEVIPDTTPPTTFKELYLQNLKTNILPTLGLSSELSNKTIMFEY